MKLTRLATALLAALALFATAASAGPAAPGKPHDHRKFHPHQQHRPMHHAPPQHRAPPRQQSQWLWERQRDDRIYNSQPRRPPQHNHHHRHPPHRDQLRREIHRQSHYLRPAPPLPRHVHLVVGRPLPHGWSHKVPPGHVRHLPHYPGYEWHSAGRDLVLVAAATGVVYTILDNVLN